MNFRLYLDNEKLHSDVRGDVIRLLRSDPDLPEFGSGAELRSYMDNRYGRLHLSDVAAIVWKMYEAAERKANRNNN